MAFVISIQGCHGVGKSTLLDFLKLEFPQYVFCGEDVAELDARKGCTTLRMDVEEEYYQIQKWYVDFEVQRFSAFPKTGIVIMDRGPEEKEYYIYHYPKLLKKHWDIEGKFGEHLKRLRTCRSSRILYLDASLASIKKRSQGDSRIRHTMENWLKNWQPYIDVFFKTHPKARVLDTNSMHSEDVGKWAVNWINRQCPLD